MRKFKSYRKQQKSTLSHPEWFNSHCDVVATFCQSATRLFTYFQIKVCDQIIAKFVHFGWRGDYSTLSLSNMNVKNTAGDTRRSIYCVNASVGLIKRNESYVGNIDFEIHPIVVWNSFCILLFSATQNFLYRWNRMSDFDAVCSKNEAL